MSTFLALGNGPAHEAYVVEVLDDDAHALTSHGMIVLHDGGDEDEAEHEAAEFVRCDAAERGEYCYSHNPTGGRL